MPKPIFRNLVLCTAGPLEGQYTPEKLRGWIKLRKGKFQESFDASVTHLLCTKDQFKARAGPIKTALKNRRVKVINYHWFIRSTFEEKRLDVYDYDLRRQVEKLKAQRKKVERLEKGVVEGERGINTTMFRVFTDALYFRYQITITRNDADAGNDGQRYILTERPPPYPRHDDSLYESNAQPALYWFLAKFHRKRGDTAQFHRPSMCSGRFDDEWAHFLEFFQLKTGIEWKDRLISEGTTDPSLFQYACPTGGKPVRMGLRHEYDECVAINQDLRKTKESATSDKRAEQGKDIPEEILKVEAPVDEDGDSDTGMS